MKTPLEQLLERLAQYPDRQTRRQTLVGSVKEHWEPPTRRFPDQKASFPSAPSKVPRKSILRTLRPYPSSLPSILGGGTGAGYEATGASGSSALNFIPITSGGISDARDMVATGASEVLRCVSE